MSYILTAWIINADIGSMLYQMLFTSSCIFRSHQDALQHKSTNEFLTFTKDHLQILTVLLYCRIPRICYTIAGNLLNDNMSESTKHIKYTYSLEIQISSVTYVDKCDVVNMHLDEGISKPDPQRNWASGWEKQLTHSERRPLTVTRLRIYILQFKDLSHSCMRLCLFAFQGRHT